MSADDGRSDSAPRRSKILLQSADSESDQPEHPLITPEDSAAPARNEAVPATEMQRLPPRVELSPAILSMLAALEKEKKPTLFWDKVKVKYAPIRRGRQELRDPPNALLLNPDSSLSLGYAVTKDDLDTADGADNAVPDDEPSEYDSGFIVYTAPRKGSEAQQAMQPYRFLLYSLFGVQAAVQTYGLSLYQEFDWSAIASLGLLLIVIAVGLLAVTKPIPAFYSAFTCAAASHTLYLFATLPSFAAVVELTGAFAILCLSLALSSISRGDWFSISSTS